MKSFIKNILLGSALALCAVGSASANQLLVFVTPGQIRALAGTSSVFGGNCNGGLTNCGVYAVGFVGAAGGTAAQTVSITFGTASVSPDSVGTDKWVGTSFLPGSGAGACDTPLGCSAFMAGGTAAGNTQEQFITGNLNTVGKTYTANLGGNSLLGVAAMSDTTDTRGMGFLLTFATNIAAGTTTNVTFELLAAKIGTTSGTEGAKNLAGQGTISGLILYATPEPGSIGLLLAGLGAIAGTVQRRRKQNS